MLDELTITYSDDIEVRVRDGSNVTVELSSQGPQGPQGPMGDITPELTSLRDQAVDASIGALASQSAAATSEDNALASKNAAAVSEANALSSKNAAAASASAAETSKTDADAAAADALASKNAAATSEFNAGRSQDAASTSEVNAAGSASAALTSRTEAANSAASALASKNAAATSEENAADAATSADASAASALASKNAAAISEANAAASEAAALVSENAAKASETNAASSETQTGLDRAAVSSDRTDVQNDKTVASQAADLAVSAQLAAETARDQMLSLYDSFDDRWLGNKATEPTTDNDGDPLEGGALFFDTTTNTMKVWVGTMWVAAYVSGTDVAMLAANGADYNPAVFRTNLDLYSVGQVDGLIIGAKARANHTGTQPASTISDFASAADARIAAAVGVTVQPFSAALEGTSASFTTTLKTKLDGIADQATKNDTDANLKNRVNHTGVMPDTGLPARLRESTALNTIADWDLALDTGWYAGWSGVDYATNGPSAHWHVGEVIRVKGDLVVQTATRITGTDADTYSWRRMGTQTGGVWSFGAWYRLRLSESEQRIVWDARYAALAHTHAIADVTGLQAALDARLEATGTAADALKFGGQLPAYYTDVLARLGYTPLDVAGGTMTGQLTFNRTPSASNRLQDWQQGYGLYSDNTSNYGSSRLWINAPDGGQVVISPRTGGQTLANFNVKSTSVTFDGAATFTINGSAAWHAGNFDPATKSDTTHTHAAATTSADGFMAAADKTKLNGIEAGATADQTGAEITALLRNQLGGAFPVVDNTRPDDFNTLTTAGWQPGIYLGSNANGPGLVNTEADSYFFCLCLVYPGGQITQILFSYASPGNQIWMRGRYGGNWSSWVKFPSVAVGGVMNVPGDIVATGNISAYSDERLKSEVETINNALDLVQNLRGVRYIKNDKRGVGVIAQEVQKVVPEVVDEGEEYLSVAYGNLVGVLIEAVKELKAEVDELKRAA